MTCLAAHHFPFKRVDVLVNCFVSRSKHVLQREITKFYSESNLKREPGSKSQKTKAQEDTQSNRPIGKMLSDSVIETIQRKEPGD